MWRWKKERPLWPKTTTRLIIERVRLVWRLRVWGNPHGMRTWDVLTGAIPLTWEGGTAYYLYDHDDFAWLHVCGRRGWLTPYKIITALDYVFSCGAAKVIVDSDSVLMGSLCRRFGGVFVNGRYELEKERWEILSKP